MNSATLKGHWKEAKGKVKKHWSKLTDEDINQVEGSFDELKEKLQDLYGYKKEEAKSQIIAFLKQHGFEDLQEDGENITDTLLDNAHYIRDTAEKFMHDSVNEIKERSTELQENVVSYVKENPVKSIGIALLAGAVAAVLLKK
ncbi:MAG: CsbD family protein [Gammaproteobacteria bacterium]|nr:CsbD family protein [Gammaproteobacteria bacterium]